MSKFINGFIDFWNWFPDLTDPYMLGTLAGCFAFGISCSTLCFGFVSLVVGITTKRAKRKAELTGG